MPQVPAENYIGTNARGSPLLDLAKLKCYKQRYTKYCAYGTAAPSNKVARVGHELGVCDYDKLVTNRILHYLTTISSRALFGQSIAVISDAQAATPPPWGIKPVYSIIMDKDLRDMLSVLEPQLDPR